MLITALAVIGGIAIGAWFRPLPNNKSQSTQPAPTYTQQQVSDAKAKVCAAYQKVRHANELARALYLGDDQVAKQVVAEGGWLALDGGSRYLSTTLAEEPATPSDLAAAVRKLADLYQILAINYMASVAHSEQDPVLRASHDVTAELERLCK
ncbi:hypothetical protein MSM1_08345 [Mycobacterium sp. SM1]|uniref:hypothetical protein n=1 Tax=Mycobacterium sp. SM1 TaxID=2816243 RepID=UPI001BCBB6A5|nr:hypothetical protein [Mycobacterium sp. SM1]MBS4728353.1 hypothetical protein [Mycobacterium sp. SM1]